MGVCVIPFLSVIRNTKVDETIPYNDKVQMDAFVNVLVYRLLDELDSHTPCS